MKIRVFGESHAPEIGVEIEGVPAGTEIDLDELRAFLARRAPGNGQGGMSTPRKEPDEPVFESGVREVAGRLTATGETMRVVIRNTNVRPQDYGNVLTVPRPGHADYSSWIKYGKIPTGGGKWSGRLTAPLCIAGGITLQMLAKRGIEVRAKIVEVGGREITANGQDDRSPAKDGALDGVCPADDSVGGVVEVVATGVPAGLGDVGPAGLESKFAAAFFGIPAVKGVEFGDGFALAAMRGSEANDAFVLSPESRLASSVSSPRLPVTLRTNHCGGILGGISVGMPIVARVAFKPTPSIAREQDSVDLKTLKPVKLAVKGRHDRCVAFRAVPVVEAAMAVTLADELQEAGR